MGVLVKVNDVTSSFRYTDGKKSTRAIKLLYQSLLVKGVKAIKVPKWLS